MIQAGKILGQVLSELKEKCLPGISTLELDQYAEKRIREQGALPGFKGYQGFPNTLCTNLNEQVVHGIPDTRPLQNGDIISIDCGVIIDGFYSDAAFTTAIGKVDPTVEKFIKTAYKALEKGIEAAQPGKRTSEISKAIEKVVKKEGYGIVRELTGHGLGQNLHEDPYIYNYATDDPGILIQPGMTFAIEPILTMHGEAIKTLSDNWTIITKDRSLSAQVEHSILITEKGPQILSIKPK